MIYPIYERYLESYIKTQKQFNEILNEKEELFERTQPHSMSFDQESVSGGGGRNAFDEYLCAKERKHIDERLAEIKMILDDRKELLKKKEQELRNSKHLFDRIYRMRYLDHYKMDRIASIIGYSKSQICRILQKIDDEIQRCN